MNDLKSAHEGGLNSMPNSYDWAMGTRMGYGNNPPLGWFAMIPAGQVYIDPNLLLATNTQIQILNIQRWYLSKRASNWKLWMQSSEVEGAHYLEDFADDVNEPANSVNLKNEGMAIQLIEGYNFHFWTKSVRITIDQTDIMGVWSSVQARLSMKDSTIAEDHDNASFMMSVGGEYWKSLTAAWDYFRTNNDTTIGRFHDITND